MLQGMQRSLGWAATSLVQEVIDKLPLEQNKNTSAATGQQHGEVGHV
jgi:hypothetical protein